MSAGDEGQCPACQSIADSGRALTAHTCDRRRRKPLTQYDPARQDEDYVDFLKWSKDSEGERVKIYTPKLKSVSGGNTVSRPFAEAVKAGKLNSLSYLPDDSPMWELPEAKELRDEALLLRSEHPAHGKTGYFHQAALGVHLRARADGGATIGIDGRRVHLDKAALAEFLEESSTAVRVYVEVFASEIEGSDAADFEEFTQAHALGMARAAHVAAAGVQLACGEAQDARLLELVADLAEKAAIGADDGPNSLRRECSALARSAENAHAARTRREMIARPKISRNESKTTENGASERRSGSRRPSPPPSAGRSATRAAGRRSPTSTRRWPIWPTRTPRAAPRRAYRTATKSKS